MQSGLNFYRWPVIMILSFVLFWGAGQTLAQGAEKEKDEFSIFDDTPAGKGSANPAKAATKETSAPVAKSPVPPNETPAQKIERLKAEIRRQPKNMTLIEQLAEAFYTSGDPEKTTLLLWRYVDKLDHSGLILLAKAHNKKHEPAEMIRALNILVGQNDKDAEALTLLGDAHVEQKKTSDALDNYTAAQLADPKYEPAYLGAIKIYEVRTPPNYYDMRILYQDMITHIGNKAEYRSRLCEINTKDKSFQNAITECKEAIDKNAQTPDNYVYLGMSYKENDQEELSLKTLKDTADRFPHSELAQNTYGQILEDKKDYVNALKYFTAATVADPNSTQGWLGVALASFDLRKYEIALPAYQKACKLDKKTAAAFRKATNILRNNRNGDWLEKYESASDTCTF